MQGKLGHNIIKKRAEILREISKIKKREFISSFHGKTLLSLILNQRDKNSGKLVALTDNYIKVLVDGDDSLINKIVNISIDRTDNDIVTGKICVKSLRKTVTMSQ